MNNVIQGLIGRLNTAEERNTELKNVTIRLLVKMEV